MITKTLKDLVKKEAKNLLIHATEEERGSLDFNDMNPKIISRCVYGQMTGNCFSHRANELIIACAERAYTPVETKSDDDCSGIKLAKLNGKPAGLRYRWTGVKYYSPIEKYILHKGAKNKELIEYLRGERKTLKL